MKFEYKIIELPDWDGLTGKSPPREKEFNEFGKEGWELISVIPIGRGGFGSTSAIRAFFKRAIK